MRRMSISGLGFYNHETQLIIIYSIVYGMQNGYAQYAQVMLIDTGFMLDSC